MEMNNDKEKCRMIKEKVDFFLSEKVKVHITKTDRSFLNGYIVEPKNDFVYVFKDNKIGTLHLFISEIYDIEEYMEVRE
jgi:hypothetical protein